jgi:hypothetical protein
MPIERGDGLPQERRLVGTMLGAREFNLIDSQRWVADQPVVELVSGDESAPATSPMWIRGVDWNADDRAQLRRALGDRYFHYRLAAAELAADARLARSGADQLADLVALLVYREYRKPVDLALRTGQLDEWSVLVARGAAQGLRHLPVAVGRLFAIGSAPPDASRYEVGSTIVEPAFIELSRDHGAASVAEFVVWSVTARRWGSGLTAMFIAGSPFRVLAVDSARVFLLDGAADRSASDTDVIVKRLRAEVVDTQHDCARLAFPLGLDDNARPFPLPGLVRRDRHRARTRGRP